VRTVQPAIFLTTQGEKPRLRTGVRLFPRVRRESGKPRKEDFNMGKLGLPEILLLLAIALLVFGPSKLADLGKGLGEGIKNFKSAVKDDPEDKDKKS
jgi:sec-independent protein translocase protein TatA